MCYFGCSGNPIKIADVKLEITEMLLDYDLPYSSITFDHLLYSTSNKEMPIVFSYNMKDVNDKNKCITTDCEGSKIMNPNLSEIRPSRMTAFTSGIDRDILKLANDEMHKKYLNEVKDCIEIQTVMIREIKRVNPKRGAKIELKEFDTKPISYIITE